MKIRSAIAATLFACQPAIAAERQSIAEFTPEESEKLDWNVVDDGVMGGLLQGKREIGKDVRHAREEQPGRLAGGAIIAARSRL